MEQISPDGSAKERNGSGSGQYAIERLGEKVDELRALEKKNYRINRIRMLCSILCLVLLTAAVAVLLVNIGRVMQEAQQITETVSNAGKKFEQVADNIGEVVTDLNQVEFAELGKTLKEIADLSKNTVEKVNHSAENLEQVVETADTVLKNFSQVKIDSLNSGIEELNRVLNDIRIFFDNLPK